jgi:hypothetical protein
MTKQSSRVSSSFLIVCGLALVGVYCFLNLGQWKKNNSIAADAISYYAYLPAAFIYHDLTLDFLEKPDCPKDVVMWPSRASNNRKVIKTSMGMAFFYAPLFFLAHGAALLFHYPATGYSPIYHLFVGYSSMLYLFLGLLYLRKILLRYFSEQITCCTIVLIGLGTNILFYYTVDTLSAHMVGFFLVSAFLYYTIRWHENQRIAYLICLGVLLGLLTLVRPTNLLVGMLFVVYSVYDRASLKEKVMLLRAHMFHLLMLPLLTILIFLPQLLYWKMQTGHYFFNSYVGERFYFSNPHIVYGLFSYRKGWLLYSPLFLLFFGGWFWLKGPLLKWRAAILLFYGVMTYVVFSWWCWWYGGGYGMRAYVDFYGLFALPVAAALHAIWQARNNWYPRVLFPLCVLLLLLNITQTYQCKRNIIHYDSMTRAAYWARFIRFDDETDYTRSLLKAPDYDKAKRGEEEY